MARRKLHPAVACSVVVFAVIFMASILTATPPSYAWKGTRTDFLSVFDQKVEVQQDTPVDIQLQGESNDSKFDEFAFGIDIPPTHGSISGFNTSTGVLTYTPDSEFVGNDEFAFFAFKDVDSTHYTSPKLGHVKLTVLDPPAEDGNQNTTLPSTSNSTGSSTNVYGMFYEPIIDALQPHVGQEIPEAVEPFDYFHNGNMSYIEYVHFREIINTYSGLGFQNLNDLQKAWLFEEIKPVIDPAFAWAE